MIEQNALLTQTSQEIQERSQYIYPEMRFTCNGTITKWVYGGVQQPSGTMLPELQIWHKLGTDNYTKIGSSFVSTTTSIGTNLYEFVPQTPLKFQEGDIFGVYIPQSNKSNIFLYEQKESGPLKLRVSGTIDNPLSTIIGGLQTDGNDFPLVTVEISKY